MRNVKMLALNNNGLCLLPSEIGHLTKLEYLYVRASERLDRKRTRKSRCFQVWRNQLTSLPAELGLLTNLKRLDVRLPFIEVVILLAREQVDCNQLTSLPAEIGQLTQLEQLDVRIRIEKTVI
jgi:internalin A